MAKDIVRIDKPTLLIWGLNDTITPPHVGHEFNALIPNSELQFIDRCCHAPMMERPEEFNVILQNWLEKNPSEDVGPHLPFLRIPNTFPERFDSKGLKSFGPFQAT